MSIASLHLKNIVNSIDSINDKLAHNLFTIILHRTFTEHRFEISWDFSFLSCCVRLITYTRLWYIDILGCA